MFDTSKIVPAFANLLGWKQHYDITEISIAPALQVSESGEFYQQKHPALRLDIIQALIPDNYPLDTYLRDVITESSVEMLNDLFMYRQVKEYGKTLLQETQLLNKYGFLNDRIVNQSRFVGWQIRPRTATGLKAIIKRIGLQFAEVESFDMYLFYSGKKDPITTITVNTTGTAQWDWTDADLVLEAFSDADIQGQVFVLGYYQDDLTSNAINQTNFNWDRGACGSCNKSNYRFWQDVNKYVTIYPIYWANGNYIRDEMPDLQDAIYASDLSWGMNLQLRVECDLSNFLVENKFQLTNLLSLKVTEKVLNVMKYSQQINFIEENIKIMIIRDLEGDLETRMNNITRKYHLELKAVNWNTSNINEKCLPCTDVGYTPNYSVI